MALPMEVDLDHLARFMRRRTSFTKRERVVGATKLRQMLATRYATEPVDTGALGLPPDQPTTNDLIETVAGLIAGEELWTRMLAVTAVPVEADAHPTPVPDEPAPPPKPIPKPDEPAQPPKPDLASLLAGFEELNAGEAEKLWAVLEEVLAKSERVDITVLIRDALPGASPKKRSEGYRYVRARQGHLSPQQPMRVTEQVTPPAAEPQERERAPWQESKSPPPARTTWDPFLVGLVFIFLAALLTVGIVALVMFVRG